MISALRTLKGRIAISAALAVALGVFAFGTATTALAAPVTPKVSLSTSASCSSKNGVATVKLTARATAKGGATSNNVSININSGAFTNTDSTGPTYEAQVTIPNASGSYSGVITADGSSNDPVQYATITANGGSCSVRVSSTPPI